MGAKHISGYDPFSHALVVGLETEDGTIEEVVEWGFTGQPTGETKPDLKADAAAARARAEQLNAACP